MNAYETNDLTWVAGGMAVGNMDNCLFAPPPLRADWSIRTTPCTMS